MADIIIKGDLNATPRNIPRNVFQSVTEVPSIISGDLHLKIVDGHVEIVLESLNSWLSEWMPQIPIEIERRQGGLIIIKKAVIAVTPTTPIIETPQDEEQVPGGEPGMTYVPTEHGDIMPVVQVTTVDPTTPGMIPVTNVVELPEDSKEDATRNMVKLMENKTTNSYSMMDTLIKDYNTSRMENIQRKRKIDELRLSVDEDPIIASLHEEVDSINNNPDNAIEKIGFNGENIVFTTKKLITDGEFDGFRRVIGRVRCSINMRPILAKESSEGRPVFIENLDHKYNDGNLTWDCGHSGTHGLCLGDVGDEQLDSAFEMRSLAAITSIIIRFLKNPNINDSWGAHIVNWPEHREVVTA